MQAFLIFLFSAIFFIGPYLVWPSRYNIPVHISVAFVFIAYFVPLVILNVQDDYPTDIVSLYSSLLIVGGLSYIIGLYLGFLIKPFKTNFSFEVLTVNFYEARVLRITRLFLIIGICGTILGYLLMGFVPMFAADPLAAKFFRNQYQVPFYTSIIYLSSFYILGLVIPIAFLIWYCNKDKVFFLIAAIVAILLLAMSLTRGVAFTGIIYSILIIAAFKGRGAFTMTMLVVVGVYMFSSVFYYIIGIRNFSDFENIGETDHLFWYILSSGTNDVNDQLSFLKNFESNPIWTYGRTIYGGLIPGHYEWHPSVFTLRVMNPPGTDVTTLINGGLRLPAPIWGYVSFQWPGVISFCFISGYFKGIICKYLKTWILEYKSMLICGVLTFTTIYLFDALSTFYTLYIYSLPPAFILIFYLYRVKWK